MDTLSLPARIFGSKEFKEMRKDAVAIYLVLRLDADSCLSTFSKVGRQDGELVTGLSVQSIADLCGMDELTVRRLIEELVRRQWIKKKPAGELMLFTLGEIKDGRLIWFLEQLVDGLVKQTWRSTKIDELLKSLVKLPDKPVEKPKDWVLPETTKFKKVEIKPYDLLMQFGRRYHEMYREKLPINRAKELALLSKCIEWCDGRGEKVREVIDFLFDHWKDITENTFLKGRPSIGMIASSNVWVAIRGWMTDGVPVKGDASISKRTEAGKKLPTEEW